MSEPFITGPVTNIINNNNNNNNNNDECTICLECVSQDKNCCVTDCGHKFHTNCLLKSCNRLDFNCPMCRQDLIEEKKEESEEEFLDRFQSEFLNFIRREREQLATQTTELTDDQVNMARDLAWLLNFPFEARH